MRVPIDRRFSSHPLVNHLKNPANQMTAIRLFLIPILWIFALKGLSMLLGAGIAIAFLTDVLDGFLARKSNQITEFGSKFDSLADNLLSPSAIIWLIMLRPELIADHPWELLVAISLYVSSIVVGLLKFRRFGNLHLYSSKVAAVIMFAFAVHTFATTGYNTWLFFLTVVAFTLSSLETLILQIYCSSVNDHMGSLLLTLANSRELSLKSFRRGSTCRREDRPA